MKVQCEVSLELYSRWIVKTLNAFMESEVEESIKLLH